MDVLGHTFDELAEHFGTSPGQRRTLRAHYRAALAGAPTSPDLVAEPAPIIRQIADGDLTKFVQQLPDGLETESVVVPMLRVHGTWHTLCVSSQVGCARGCAFCETAQLGLLRNLTAAEIVGQVAIAQRLFNHTIRNVVFMGMGEAFDNFEQLVQALRVLMDHSGWSFAGERLTISTAGHVPAIRRFATLGLRRVNLAISLNAPNDTLRSQLMPINDRYPLHELRAALLEYPLRRAQYLMVEYVLIPGVNDAPEHAEEVAEYLRPLKAVLNVIAYNPRHESPWPAATTEDAERFVAQVNAAGQIAKRRVTKGRDHMAACGQLGNRNLRRK